MLSMADRPGAGYRDELGAAHARIEQLEARLRERDKLGARSKLLPRLRGQKATLERRIRDNRVLTRLAAFGAVVWFGLGLLVHSSQRAGMVVPVIAAVFAYIAMSSAQRERQLESDDAVLDENIAEAEQLVAGAEKLAGTETAVRVDLGSASPESAAEPEGPDERREDHHEHSGRMGAR
jgi:hypothetical protein